VSSQKSYNSEGREKHLLAIEAEVKKSEIATSGIEAE
jgi:hypothetical protein